ncbi:hypothetical protein OG422_19270 [Streptomyces sp. NBC_01525]|uniref:hypothetical protein n=1 Tax=Streptomyces sp. NBC_01525 TaxID=2903893 RepID=UPI0038703B1F
MTQSGQGHDPQNAAGGPAQEGVVLPAGGETWTPAQQAAPPAGQPWGQPWGPDQQSPQAYGQSPEQPQGQISGQYPGPSQGFGQGQAPTHGQGLPSTTYGQGLPPQQPPQAQQHQGYGPGQPSQQPQPYAQPQQTPAFPPPPQGQPPMPPTAPRHGAGQLPPAVSDAEETALIPPFGMPGALPPEGAVAAPGRQGLTGQLVKATPQPAAPLPPVAGDADSTTLLPPVGAQPTPGAAPLPPETAGRPETPGESTQMLRSIKPPRNRAAAPPAAPGDSEATQLIPPVGAGAPAPQSGAPFGAQPGGAERPTPAEFEGLFRADSGAAAPPPAPDATAQLPRFDDQAPPPCGPGGGRHGFPSGGHDAQPGYGDEPGGRRRLSPVVITGIVVVALAGAGLGLGWALSGDDETKKGEPKVNAADAAPKDTAPPSPTVDPAAEQAKKLDALLGDSNNSRSAVINAVRNIGNCDNLPGAAKNLKDAANQRNQLVSRLQGLPLDKLPQHAELTAALTTAWKSSAAADNHYAAWAGQVAGKHGCHKGHARNTGHTAQGTAASGAATKAKEQAAGLWNPIAQKYGLRTHQAGDL